MMNQILRPIGKCLSLASCLVALSSCATKEVVDEPVAAPAVGKNAGYGNASARGPVPQNPDMYLGSDISGLSRTTVMHGSRDSKMIALTFDDGPSSAHTPRLLDMLRRRNVKATFYVLGERAARHPEIIRRIVSEGHEIGNHTWSHRSLKTLGEAAVRKELESTRDTIVKAAGIQPRTMRPPYGAMHTSQRNWVKRDYGYPIVMWDVDPLDWKRPGASVVASRLIKGCRNGSILLVHDIHGASVDAMPQTIDTLLRKGYHFVTVSQLLAAETSVAAQ